MEKLILKDNNGRNYEIKNPQLFYQHLLEFHTLKGKADNSIHQENDFYFTVTSEIMEKVINFITNKLNASQNI